MYSSFRLIKQYVYSLGKNWYNLVLKVQDRGSLTETGRGMPHLFVAEKCYITGEQIHRQPRWCAVGDKGSNRSGVWKYSTWSPRRGSLQWGNVAWVTDWPKFGSWYVLHCGKMWPSLLKTHLLHFHCSACSYSSSVLYTSSNHVWCGEVFCFFRQLS